VAAQRPHFQHLEPSPATVAWGYYWSAARPVLTIASGDTIEVHTLITSSPTRLESAGVPAAQVESSLRDIYAQVTDKGPGGHILTGPIYVTGAEPGDVLEVRILAARLAVPYAYNGFRPGSGFLPADFSEGRTKIIPLDAARMVARFAEGIEIPLRPFFGSMGVAPPDSMGRINSAPPGIHAGNLDNRELVAGTTLFIPVHVRGALFEVGDGQAQGGGAAVGAVGRAIDVGALGHEGGDFRLGERIAGFDGGLAGHHREQIVGQHFGRGGGLSVGEAVEQVADELAGALGPQERWGGVDGDRAGAVSGQFQADAMQGFFVRFDHRHLIGRDVDDLGDQQSLRFQRAAGDLLR